MHLAESILSGTARLCDAVMGCMRRITGWLCNKGPIYQRQEQATSEARREEVGSALKAMLLASVAIPMAAASTHAASSKAVAVIGDGEKLLSKEMARLLDRLVPCLGFVSGWFLVFGFALIALLKWKEIVEEARKWGGCAVRLYYATMGFLGFYTMAPRVGVLDRVKSLFGTRPRRPASAPISSRARRRPMETSRNA